MKDEERYITFTDEDDNEVKLHVIEQTKINGFNYLLVEEDTDDEEPEALILRETSEEGAAEAVYDVVDDETELQAIADVFAELLEDIEII